MRISPPHPRLWLIAILGFFSGLPLALTASTLSAWLAEAGVTTTTIGLFAAIATPYAFKFLWAPLLDGLPLFPSRLGRRRGWLAASQALLKLFLALMAITDPTTSPGTMALLGLLVATCSATQDTVFDAFRVEHLPPEAQGNGAAFATFGYRIGMLASGAGALYLATDFGWTTTYFVMAGVMGLGVLVTLSAGRGQRPEARDQRGAAPASTMVPPASNLASFLRTYFLAPLRAFATRPYWGAVLAFVILYKLGDAFMGPMFNPFLLGLGFTKLEIAQTVKLYGLIATLVGSFAGGWLVARLGTFRTLVLGGMLHMLTNLMLVALASRGPDLTFLTLAISLENFTGGMVTTAFVAYLSGLTQREYTATQYALLSSLAAFGRTWLSTPSGAVAEALGWEGFFTLASLLALPGIALLIWLERVARRQPSHAGGTP